MRLTFLKRYTMKDFFSLYLPLLGEQAMATFVGLVGMLMVSHAGDAALSAVGIVNTINLVVLSAFTALASGATAVISQLLGARRNKDAGACTTQFLVVSVSAAIIIGTLMTIFVKPILYAFFGSSEQDVLDSAYIYLAASSLSVPFLVVSTSISGIFRACRDNKTPMFVSIIVNIINALICAVTIYIIEIGILGASIAMLVARIIGSILSIIMLLKPGMRSVSMPFAISKSFKVQMETIKPIMKIGLPMGLDSMIFQVGKLIVTVFLSGMGTSMMAAFSVANNITMFFEIPGSAMMLLAVTLVGRSVGAGDDKAAKDEMLLTLAVNSVLFALICIPGYFLSYQMASLFSASEEVRQIAVDLVKIFCALTPIMWAPGFMLPYGLRAAGDVKFTIICSSSILWLVRVPLSYVYGVVMNMGAVGIWWAMIADWVARNILYMWRLLSDKWRGKSVIRAKNIKNT